MSGLNLLRAMTENRKKQHLDVAPIVPMGSTAPKCHPGSRAFKLQIIHDIMDPEDGQTLADVKADMKKHFEALVKKCIDADCSEDEE